MSKSSLTPSSVSQKLSTTPPAAHPANQPAASSNKSGRHSFVVKLHLVVAGTELGDDDPFILYWYCLLWLHSQVYNILKPLSEILPSINTPQPIPMTTISFHRAESSPLILSGSSDDLLAISNPDEDEAMLHVRSWGISISHADWYCSSANASSYGV